MRKIILIIFLPVFFIFTTCALEIANVIGPGGGWVFYDKGNYEGGWRYIMCAPHDFAQISAISEDTEGEPNLIKKALEKCRENSGGHYKYDWELPTDEDLRRMLECFSYGLTQFSSDYHYLSINKCHAWIEDCHKVCIKECENDCDKKCDIEKNWEDKKVIYHKNFKKAANGVPEIVEDYTGMVRIRAIRRF